MTARSRPGTGPTVPASLVPPLLRWYRAHRRPLPWRRDRDPYRVWVAEVLLQQTRVAQAAPYFERFVARFPDVGALARARASEVLKAWQGAGYYARARNLHAAARLVRQRHGGRLPRTVPELEALPGVGPYTARAIASLAFDAPEIALEANGLRVAARWTAEEGDLRSAEVRGRLARALQGILPSAHPGEFLEAVMELGETVCHPTAPVCGACPAAFACRARQESPDPGAFPRRRARPSRPRVHGAVVVLGHGNRWLVQRRPSRGLLGGLWEFPGGKVGPGETPREAALRELAEETGIGPLPLADRGVVHHAYSHFSVTLHVFTGQLGNEPRRAARRWVTPTALSKLPLPKATEKVAHLVLHGPGRPSGSAP